MNLRRTRAIAHKEVLHIWRDPRSLIIALAVPVLMLLLFGYALSLDVDRIPTLIYDSDHSPESRALIDRFQASRYFQVLRWVDGYDEIEESIDRGEALLGMAIPENYSRRLRRGEVALVQLLLDGSDSNTASIARGYAEALVEVHASSLNRPSRFERPVEARVRIWYNSELESKNFIVPGLVAVILMIIAALLTSLTIAREWETGTMEQLLSTPVRPAELVLGKLSAYFALGAIDTLVAVLIGVFLFDVPLRGGLLFLAASCFLFLFGALCWGILLSALARSQLLAYQISMVSSFLPAFMLSGFIYPIEEMPLPIQLVTFAIPARYFIRILKGVFLKGTGLEVLAVEVAFLVAFAGLVFLVATHKLGQKVA